MMAPQDVYILLPEAVNMLLYVAKGLGEATCALIKHLEMRRLSQITWVGPSQGSLEGRQESPSREGDVIIEVGVRVREI